MPDRSTLPRLAERAWHWLRPASWRRLIARLAAVSVLLAAAAFAFLTLGLTPIAADEGHWPITQRVLQYAMTRTVRMQSLDTSAPALDEPALLLEAAGHYDTQCMPCHGAPGRTRARVVAQMVPSPPYLAEVVDEWKPRELHWIVKHGIKYTAMPAWTSQKRDDEVWAMVAFLKRLPGLDAAQYDVLALGPLASAPHARDELGLRNLRWPPVSIVDNCTRCHGVDGRGRGDIAIPPLAGQREAYLLASLQAFARGERHSGVMQTVATGLDAAQMRALARHFASLPRAPAATAGAADAAARARGASLAARGIGAQRIPACRHCHGPGADATNPLYPRLAGLPPRYLARQLRLCQQGQRGGTRYWQLMHRAAASLDDRQIEDLATYYATLGGDSLNDG